METRFSQIARKHSFSNDQKSIIVGSMLGDGYLVRTTSGYAFRVNHSIKQSSYVYWKYKKLREVVRTGPKQSGSCIYFRTVTHQWLTELHDIFYDGTRKIVPIDVVAKWASPLLLATWFMDDGTKEGDQVRFNTQCFTRKENEMLIEFLQAKFGIHSTINRDKNHYRLRVSARGMSAFIASIKHEVIPDMLYKLPL